MVLHLDIRQDRLGRFLVVCMRRTITVCELLHPGMTVTNQPFAECFTNGVARANDAVDACQTRKSFSVFQPSS